MESTSYGFKAFQNVETGQVWANKLVNEQRVALTLSEDAQASLKCLFAGVREHAPGIIRSTKNPAIVSLNVVSDASSIQTYEGVTIVRAASASLSTSDLRITTEPRAEGAGEYLSRKSFFSWV